MFLFDTDHMSILQIGEQPAQARILDRMRGLDMTDFFVSIISFQEQMTGWIGYLSKAKSIDEVIYAYDMHESVLNEYAAAQILPFDDRAGKEFLALKRVLRHVGVLDLRIAAVALVNDKTLFSRNVRDFVQVPGLRVEDWTRPT